MIRVKAPREEFEAGESGGYIYGEIRRQKRLPVYVELGSEEEYQPMGNDDPKTDYRMFKGCSVYVAETEEQLDRGEYLTQTENVTVLIYC